MTAAFLSGCNCNTFTISVRCWSFIRSSAMYARELMCSKTRCIFVIYMQIKLDISVCKIHRLFTVIVHQLQVLAYSHVRHTDLRSASSCTFECKIQKFGTGLDIRNVCINVKNEYYSTPSYHLDPVGATKTYYYLCLWINWHTPKTLVLRLPQIGPIHCLKRIDDYN